MCNKKENSFIITVSEQDLQVEKQKVRKIKKTQWWKRKLSKRVCYYCGKSFPISELTLDHIVPLIRGGKTTKSNIAVACKTCNAVKKYLLPIEWEEYLDRLKEK